MSIGKLMEADPNTASGIIYSSHTRTLTITYIHTEKKGNRKIHIYTCNT
jgi:hypothetical protein